MNTLDFTALCFFILCWFLFDKLINGGFRFIGRVSLTQAMHVYRKRWIINSLTRDWKMIDTQILSGLQNGTAFFASTSIFAIGGCFALINEADRAQLLFQDLPFMLDSSKVAFEMKAGGLAAMFGYSFFKFGWSYRLFNYNTILFGTLPMINGVEQDREGAEQMANKVAELNIIASQHFNAGLRAIFLSIGYLGWFLGPYVFIGTTAFVFMILLRRQYFSTARRAVLGETDTIAQS